MGFDLERIPIMADDEDDMMGEEVSSDKSEKSFVTAILLCFFLGG